jgi:hypothetical protein
MEPEHADLLALGCHRDDGESLGPYFVDHEPHRGRKWLVRNIGNYEIAAAIEDGLENRILCQRVYRA